MKIVLQPGHINIQYNSDLALRNSTGAPGEQEFTLRIVNRLSEVLRSKGFEVKQTDANANDDPTVTKVDWDLFLAVHYDANIYGTGGGFVDFPEPSTDDATVESQRIVKVIEDTYFANSGIVNVPSRRNANTKFYYMWKYLTGKTPCAIIECGVGKDAHDSVILADTDIVANAIARSICKAFNVIFDTPPPVVIPPVITPPAQSSCEISLSQCTTDLNASKTLATNCGASLTTTTTNLNNAKAKLKQINDIASKSYFFYKGTFRQIKDLSA